MGRASQDKVYKKLLSTYMKFNLNKANFVNPNVFSKTLLECFQRKGVGHPDCRELKKVVDQDYKQAESTFDIMVTEVREYPEILNTHLYNVKHKYEYKGRHHVRKDYYYEIKENLEKMDI